MKIVMYVVSTLSRSGPTNQLFNIIKYLNKDSFRPYIVTLSPEPKDSRKSDFEKLGVSIESLKLSRIEGVFKSKSRLKQIIASVSPDIIHTQGIRADSLLCSISDGFNWLLTSRNFPFDDYPMKFGKFKGTVMAFKHMKVQKKCSNTIACSSTIAAKLKEYGINASVVHNGIEFNTDEISGSAEVQALPKPVFITVGSLNKRKNVRMLIDAFNKFSGGAIGSLIVLGDGPEMAALKEVSASNVFFYGNVSNVKYYLDQSDYFVSASLSEGLPNTVLEALHAGVPTILSDIPSHKEIADAVGDACCIFNLAAGVSGLALKMKEAQNIFSAESSEKATAVMLNSFSAEIMSRKYQRIYDNFGGN